MRKWVQESSDHLYSHEQAKLTIKVFQRKTQPHDKALMLEEFRKTDSQSRLRVICATEALGMGADLPDVRRVVQYSIQQRTTASVLMQRGGRASRDGKPGEMIFLFPAWIQGPSSPPPLPKERKSMGIQQRRGSLDPFIYKLVNELDKCPREQLLDHFNEPADFWHDTNPARCCHFHNAEFRLGDLTRFYVYTERGPMLTDEARFVLGVINKWVNEMAQKEFEDALFPVSATETLLMSEQERKDIAIASRNLNDLKAVVSEWEYAEEYASKLIPLAAEAYNKARREKHHKEEQQRQKRRQQHKVLQTPLSQNSMQMCLSQPSTAQHSIAWLEPQTPVSLPKTSPLSQDIAAVDYCLETQNVATIRDHPESQNTASSTTARRQTTKTSGPKRQALTPLDGNSQIKRSRSGRVIKPTEAMKEVLQGKENKAEN